MSGANNSEVTLAGLLQALNLVEILWTSLLTAICSPAKQNDRPHESYLAQVMAKVLLFNFVLLPNF